MTLIEEMEKEWLVHKEEFSKSLPNTLAVLSPEQTAALWSLMQMVLIMEGADMLRMLV